MKNVCRPFYLFNDYLPPSKTPAEDMQWKILGYYDDMQVGKNLFDGDDGTIDFQKLWNAQISKNTKLCGSYSLQTVFGLRDNDDEYFWEKESTKEYPFLFFSMLQVGKSICDIESLGNCEELEETYSNNEVQTITYYSIDYSDIIVVLKCKQYEVGAKIIEDIHLGKAGFSVTYGYSFAAINMRIVNDQVALQNITGNAKNIQIYIIAKELELADTVFDKMVENIQRNGGKSFIDKISKQTLLGCNDLKFQINELPWNMFLSFYKNKNGIFNHTSKIYQDNLIGVTTIIGTDFNLKKQTLDTTAVEAKSDEENVPKLCRKLAKRWQIWQERNSENGGSSHLGRYIISIINSLGKFEVSPIHDYLFQTMLTQLNMIMDMAEQAYTDTLEIQRRLGNLETEDSENINIIQNALSSRLETINYGLFSSAYSFIREFSLYVQNSVRSDRQFTQAPDFDVRVYETPVKLIAFYNAYIYNMKEYLSTFVGPNGSEHEYVFLAYPGVTDFVKNKEKFRSISDTKRLFLMELPEIDTYRPNDLMIILGHEVAHNVGGGIRNREKRAEITKDILAYLYVKYVRMSWCKYGNQEDREEGYRFIPDDDIWNEMTRKIKTIINYRERRTDETEEAYSDNMKFLLDKRKYHAEQVIAADRRLITNVAQEDIKTVWHDLLKREYYYRLADDTEDATKRMEELQHSIREWNAEFVEDSDSIGSFNVLGVLEILFYFYKECIADLICIRTHNVSFREYVELIVRELEYQGQKDFEHLDRYYLRIALVIYCMVNYGDEAQRWKKDELTEDIFTNEHCKIMANSAICENDRYLAEKPNDKKNAQYKAYSRISELVGKYCPQENLIADAIPVEDAIRDGYVLEQIVGYLKECLCSFEEAGKVPNDNRQEKLDRLKSMYSMFAQEGGCKNISAITVSIHRHITEYYEEIREKNMSK